MGGGNAVGGGDAAGGGTGGGLNQQSIRGPMPRHAISMGWNALRWSTDAELDSAFDAMDDLGVGALRTDLWWNLIQPTDAATWDWSGFDRVVTKARQHGIQLMPIIGRSPAWARPGNPNTNGHPSPTAFAAFAGAAAARYGPQGIHYWEVWNEPNLDYFFSPPDAVAYTALLNAAYDAIKLADSEAFVVSGGLSPAPQTSPGNHVSAIEFTQAMYQHAPKLDAFGFHPYGWPLPPSSTQGWQGWRIMVGNSTSIRSIMVANGHSGRRVWLTEYGSPSVAPSVAPPMTGAMQRDFLVEAFQMASQTPWVGPLFYYSLRDIGADPQDTEDWYGLLRNDWSQKPAYGAFKTLPPEPPVLY